MKSVKKVLYVVGVLSSSVIFENLTVDFGYAMKISKNPTPAYDSNVKENDKQKWEQFCSEYEKNFNDKGINWYMKKIDQLKKQTNKLLLDLNKSDADIRKSSLWELIAGAKGAKTMDGNKLFNAIMYIFEKKRATDGKCCSALRLDNDLKIPDGWSNVGANPEYYRKILESGYKDGNFRSYYTGIDEKFINDAKKNKISPTAVVNTYRCLIANFVEAWYVVAALKCKYGDTILEKMSDSKRNANEQSSPIVRDLIDRYDVLRNTILADICNYVKQRNISNRDVDKDALYLGEYCFVVNIAMWLRQGTNLSSSDSELVDELAEAIDSDLKYYFEMNDESNLRYKERRIHPPRKLLKAYTEYFVRDLMTVVGDQLDFISITEPDDDKEDWAVLSECKKEIASKIKIDYDMQLCDFMYAGYRFGINLDTSPQNEQMSKIDKIMKTRNESCKEKRIKLEHQAIELFLATQYGNDKSIVGFKQAINNGETNCNEFVLEARWLRDGIYPEVDVSNTKVESVKDMQQDAVFGWNMRIYNEMQEQNIPMFFENEGECCIKKNSNPKEYSNDYLRMVLSKDGKNTYDNNACRTFIYNRDHMADKDKNYSEIGKIIDEKDGCKKSLYESDENGTTACQKWFQLWNRIKLESDAEFYYAIRRYLRWRDKYTQFSIAEQEKWWKLKNLKNYKEQKTEVYNEW